MAIKLKNKFIIISLLGLLLLLLTACPQDTFCFEEGGVPLPDKIIIIPNKRMFNSGEKMKIIINIPSKINTEEIKIDIHNSLNVEESSRFFNISNIIDGNEFTINKGRLDKNSQLYLSYNPENDNYEFECEITLNRKGNYRQFDSKATLVFTKDEGNCEFIAISTNIKGINQNGFYEFTVV